MRADMPSRPTSDAAEWRHGSSPQHAKADGDTVVLIGPWDSGAPYNGQFESPTGAACALDIVRRRRRDVSEQDGLHLTDIDSEFERRRAA